MGSFLSAKPVHFLLHQALGRQAKCDSVPHAPEKERASERCHSSLKVAQEFIMKRAAVII